jgi:hypothetical protein
VVAYYNSAHFHSKRRAFDLFSASMERSGIPVFVGECAFGDDPFELPPSASVFRFRGRDEIWQKERLINLVVERLPDRYAKIAWLDADILFDNPLWAIRTSELLDELLVIQPFERAIRLLHDQTTYTGASDFNQPSFCFVHSALPELTRFGGYSVHGHPGFGWAANRDLWLEVGLYDGAIMGSGDHLMAHAFAGDFCSACIPNSFGRCQSYLEDYRTWATAAWEHVRGKLGSVPGAALHLWHGNRPNRQYWQRNLALFKLNYDPNRHLSVLENGLWCWSDADDGALREWTQGYFRARQEDVIVPSQADAGRTGA